MREGRSKKVLPTRILSRSSARNRATVKDKPFSPKFGKFVLRFALGLFVCFFLLNYQPVFSFPPIKKNLVFAQNQPEQSQTVSAQSLPIAFQLPHPGYLSTPFSSYHPGIDIATGLGMPIRPIAKGVVVSTGYNFWGLGLIVEVDHGSGYRSLYAHMGKIYVPVGKTVGTDDLLGEVGITGNTTGPHTHLQVSLNNNNIDPLKLLPELRTMPLAEDFASSSAKLNKLASTPAK